MKLVHWVFVVCLFTSSFDLILNFQLGGSFRFAQILMIFICVAAMARIIQDGRILWFRGATALSLWLVGQALCLPLSGNITIGIEFFALLLFTCVGVLAVVQLYGQSDLVEPLMKMYMASFVFVAAFGLVQFFIPLLFGISPPLVTQWLIHGRLARISGFSYEPSYFGTYLVIGWIMLVELRISKARIAQGKFWKWATIIVTSALLLSSSKTAWLFMLVELLARLAPPVWRTFRHALHDIASGRLLFRPLRRRTLSYFFLAAVLMGFAAVAVSRLPSPAILLSGSGLIGTPAHSYNIRTDQANATIASFEDAPFVGRSLGGVPVYIAARSGVRVTTRDQMRLYWGFPVLLSVLVASGVIGFIPFAVFLYITTFGAYRFAKRYWPQERAKWLCALARAMIFEWMFLMVDQNLLRVYLWFHFTMVIVVAYHLEYAPAPRTLESGADSHTLSMIEAHPAS